jgi:hypothetical protein
VPFNEGRTARSHYFEGQWRKGSNPFQHSGGKPINLEFSQIRLRAIMRENNLRIDGAQ